MLCAAAPTTRRMVVDTTRAIVFHDLRGTDCTWMAVRGDDALKSKQRAGHQDLKTTEGYIATAEASRDGFGEPIPALPASLAPAHDERPISSPSSSAITPGDHPSATT